MDSVPQLTKAASQLSMRQLSASKELRWAVAIDGSELSMKSLKVAETFLDSNDGEDDYLAAINVYSPDEISKLPGHLRPEHIQHAIEPELGRIAARYQCRGSASIKTEFFSVPQKGTGKATTRAALLQFLEETVKPHLVFIGSWGRSGEKVDCLGTITDGTVSLIKTHTAVIKNTYPVPDFDAGTLFMVCIDGSKDSIETCWWVRRMAKSHDRMLIVTAARTETHKEQEYFDQVRAAIKTARKDDRVALEFSVVIVPSLTTDAIGTGLCEHGLKVCADFIVCGSRGLTGSARFNPQQAELGSVSYFIAQNSRLHTIVTKPGYLPMSNA